MNTISSLLKKTTFTLFSAAAITASVCSCNDISADDRFIEVPAVEARRTVLLEEFTGQKCINCPDAHIVIAQLAEQYPDNFIPVSIHAGGNAFSYGEGQFSSIVGLRLEEGEQYSAEAGVLSYPAGVLDRRSGVQTMDKWPALLREELERSARMDIAVKATLSPSDGNITINAEVIPYEAVDGNLQLWIVENGIVARQILSSGSYDKDYVHNHVFRGSVNGHDGEPVVLKPNISQSFTYSLTPKENWNTDNLGVVAFVYSTDGVEQAAHTKITKLTE